MKTRVEEMLDFINKTTFFKSEPAIFSVEEDFKNQTLLFKKNNHVIHRYMDLGSKDEESLSNRLYFMLYSRLVRNSFEVFYL